MCNMCLYIFSINTSQCVKCVNMHYLHACLQFEDIFVYVHSYICLHNGTYICVCHVSVCVKHVATVKPSAMRFRRDFRS